MTFFSFLLRRKIVRNLLVMKMNQEIQNPPLDRSPLHWLLNNKLSSGGREILPKKLDRQMEGTDYL